MRNKDSVNGHLTQSSKYALSRNGDINDLKENYLH